MLVLALFLVAGVPQVALADSTARYDPRCDAMHAVLPSPEVLLGAGSDSFRERPVPRQLLLVALSGEGSLPRGWLGAWRQYAQQFGFAIYEAIGELPLDWHAGLAPQIVGLIGEAAHDHRHAEADKLLRWALLAQRGGIIVDTAVWPPAYAGVHVDFAAIMPLRGLVVVAGPSPRNLAIDPNVSGLTVSDGLILACPQHPVLMALVDTLPKNLTAVRRAYPELGLTYEAGAFLLSRMLTGSFTVMPYNFLHTFGVSHAP